MAKSRKQKTKEKKQAKTVKMKETKAKDLPNDEKEKKPENKKIKKEKDNIVLLFGRKPNSEHIHAILEGNTAVCDSRRNNLEVMGLMTSNLQVCASCMKTKIYKEFLEQENKIAKVSEDKSKPWLEEETTKQTNEEKTESRFSYLENVKETLENLSKDIESILSRNYLEKDQIKTLITTNLNYTEKRLEKRLKEFVKELFKQNEEQFYVVSKQNGIFSIVHRPSQYVIVDGINEEICTKLLTKYLSIEERWNGTGQPPKDWLTKVTKVFEENKEESKIFLDNRRKERKEIKLTARRKGRKPKANIRRRSKIK